MAGRSLNSFISYFILLYLLFISFIFCYAIFTRDGAAFLLVGILSLLGLILLLARSRFRDSAHKQKRNVLANWLRDVSSILLDPSAGVVDFDVAFEPEAFEFIATGYPSPRLRAMGRLLLRAEPLFWVNEDQNRGADTLESGTECGQDRVSQVSSKLRHLATAIEEDSMERAFLYLGQLMSIWAPVDNNKPAIETQMAKSTAAALAREVASCLLDEDVWVQGANDASQRLIRHVTDTAWSDADLQAWSFLLAYWIDVRLSMLVGSVRRSTRSSLDPSRILALQIHLAADAYEQSSFSEMTEAIGDSFDLRHRLRLPAA